jgi:hypothetical protein
VLIERGQQQGVIRTNDSPAVLAHGNAGVVNNYCAATAWGHLDGLTDEEVAHIAARYIIRSLAATSELADEVDARFGPKPRRSRARTARERKTG